ncbi:unnamed protein product [Dracunculus medinensis]|uniref:Homeobox domain-containing protein n=1 Tax=Dracunculus medinensis TaxID=318479 RepID=A0A0N4UNJ1_DRAME|nr:unnamed protein product [Dracunculus medinensis]
MSISKKLPFGIHSILADDPSSLISSNSMGCESNAFIIFPIPSIYKSFSTFPYSVHDLSKIFNETSEENSNRTLNISILNKIGSQSQNYFHNNVTQHTRRERCFRKIGHPYQKRTAPKNKKPRTSFSKKQLALLERRFINQKYLASTERASLASELDMSDTQVKTWFQNRRTKWRRQEAEDREYDDKINAQLATSCPKCFFARPDIIL